MRRDGTGEDAWSALWNGDEAHDVQATGMLSAIVAPLAAGGVPVWVVSSYDGDLVLVPTDRLDEASEVLRAADPSLPRSAWSDASAGRAGWPGLSGSTGRSEGESDVLLEAD